MKSTFPEYFDSDEVRLRDLWNVATFVFDTNCLLDFYRLGEKNVSSYFQAFESVSERLWLPYQVDYEYSRRRRDIVEKQIAEIDKFQAHTKNLRQFFDLHCLSYMDGVLDPANEIYENVLALSPALEQGCKKYREHCRKVDEDLDKLFCVDGQLEMITWSTKSDPFWGSVHLE
ncbi:MAG: hypothetical protein IPK73_08365 [Candidatus Obscuribacter sp.]|nr:hypothetical protein [Candidatus Obscuribacter sp.]MBK9279616.1 hypothetical protein [Candidatus Obscuribacter sp.]